MKEGVSARMVEMQMRVYNDGYVFRSISGNFRQGPSKCSFAINAVNLGFFRSPFFADTGLDQDLFDRRLDEQAIHVEPNAIKPIRQTNTLPKNTRDDSEHRPSVQSEYAVGNDLDAVIA